LRLLEEKGIRVYNTRQMSLRAHWMVAENVTEEHRYCYSTIPNESITLLKYRIYNSNGSEGFELISQEVVYQKFNPLQQPQIGENINSFPYPK
jgi:hypothetical protein